MFEILFDLFAWIGIGFMFLKKVKNIGNFGIKLIFSRFILIHSSDFFYLQSVDFMLGVWNSTVGNKSILNPDDCNLTTFEQS